MPRVRKARLGGVVGQPMLNQRERASGELANDRSERAKVIVGQDADAEERAVFMLEHDTYWLDE